MLYTMEELKEAQEEMIGKVDEEVYKSIIQYVLNNQGGDTHDGYYNTEWLEMWARAKAPLYLKFGRRLRVSRDIDIQVDKSEGVEIAKRFCDVDFKEDKFLLVREIFKLIVGAKGGYDTQCKRHRGDSPPVYLMTDIDMESIAKNILPSRIELFGKSYERNSKITSVLRDLVRKEDREEFDIIYSRFIQSLNAKGKMSVSIDPIDFLTMSENQSNWSSCHSLDGEFRAGTVSYMLDSHTTIAYVQNSKLASYHIMGDLKWNSKKWRQVVYVNAENNTFVQTREYPSSNRGFNNGVYNLLSEKVFGEVSLKRLTTEKGQVEESSSGWIDNIYFSEEELHYNDLIHCSCERSFAFPEELEFNKVPIVRVGANVPCICGCGDEVARSGSLHGPNHASNYYYDEDEDEDEY